LDAFAATFFAGRCGVEALSSLAERGMDKEPRLMVEALLTSISA
jgi:hypothetical protein